MNDPLTPTAGWCPPGGCATRQRATLDLAVTLAFEQGRTYERAELAALELTTWLPIARTTHEQKVAERAAALPGATKVPPLRFDEPGWPPVAVPGGGGVRLGLGQIIDGRPDYLQYIAEPFPCGCNRLPDGRHRVPDSGDLADAPDGAAA
ncbi:hypothetical protein [Micromonospora wenchangensis]|uniref:hypothetical protein n=1 Tax=Micromonospora wenchangensis TaxID=1185415 RepID=UPI00380BDE59